MFSNPVKAQSISAPSVQRPVQDSSVQTALSGFADILQTLSQPSGDTGDKAWQVKAEWETEGSQAAIEDAKQYQTIVESKGRAAGDVWLNKRFLERQGSMVADTADTYRKVVGDVIGKTTSVVDREFEQSEQQRVAQKMQDYKIQGTSLAMVDGAKYGLDPAKMSEDSLVGLAMMYEGTKLRTEERTKQVALQSSELDLQNKERVLKSEAGANAFLGQQTAQTKAALFAALESMRQNPDKAEQIKLQAIADLELKKSSVLATAASEVRRFGGDISDVTSGQVQAVQAQYDTMIKMLRGDYAVDIQKVRFDNLAYGTALEAVPEMPDEMERLVLVQHVTKMPLNAAEAVLRKGKRNFDPNAQYEVIRNLGLGVNTAIQNTGETPARWMQTFSDAAVGASKNEQARPKYASALVNTLMESYQGPASLRQQASGIDSLPALHSSLAKSSLKGELSQDIQNAAASEGMTPAELWQKSTVGVIREKIAPSLQFNDPAIQGNLDVKYSGGKFTVRLNEQGYRKATNLSANPGYYSGIDASMTKINGINQNLLKFQQVLNDSVQSYVKTVGGNPDDVGLALEQIVQLTFKLSNQE